MAASCFFRSGVIFLVLVQCFLFLMGFVVSQTEPTLNWVEQESVYRVLESVSSDIPWRTLFSEDLCSSPPHGIVCDYFTDQVGNVSAHVVELSFGYVSDYSPNPPCSSGAVLDSSLFSKFPHLTKLFFYRCFTDQATNVVFPDFSSLGSSLEVLVFMENPSLVGALGSGIGNLTRLRRLVITGTGVSGALPEDLGCLNNLEQLTLSRNKFTGSIVSVNFTGLKNLKVLDLSQNGFVGSVPESIGKGLKELLKLDLSFNQFSGRIPESLKGLKKLEFLDLSNNGFGKFGVPLFLGEMQSLKEVYLSGNLLGGKIPEIWGNLNGILGIGLSETGLVGNIPASMAIHLRNAAYLGLDNNNLEGNLPQEFGLLDSINELNLKNNKLSGKVPFSAEFVGKIGDKLKLEGNTDLCVDEQLKYAMVGSKVVGQMKMCLKQADIPQSALLLQEGSFTSTIQSSSATQFLMFFILCFFMLSL